MRITKPIPETAPLLVLKELIEAIENGEFPQKVKSFRKQHGLSQTQLAQKVRVSLRTIQRWESGESKPHGASLFLLANLMSELEMGV